MSDRSELRAHGSTVASIDAHREQDYRSAVWGRRGRRAAVVVLVTFVMIGLLGGFGYREGTLADRTGRFDVRLDYPRVTRGGLPAHWAVTLNSDDGLPLGREVVLETTSGYFEIFDHNDLVPAPDRVQQTGESTIWTFDLSDEVALRVSLDIRTQPNARWRRAATTQVRIDGELVSVLRYETVVLP